MTRVGRWSHLYTFVAQLVIVAVMMIVSLLPRSGMHTPIILGLAGLAAILALLYPMGLRRDRGASRLLLLAFILLIVILTLLTALDVGTRHVMERPPL